MLLRPVQHFHQAKMDIVMEASMIRAEAVVIPGLMEPLQRSVLHTQVPVLPDSHIRLGVIPGVQLLMRVSPSQSNKFPCYLRSLKFLKCLLASEAVQVNGL